jgi:hypothetical protein
MHFASALSASPLSSAFSALPRMIGVLSPGEFVLVQQLADLELHQVQQLLVVHHVHLVQEDDDVRHAHLTGQQDVLARLGHGAVTGRNHQHRAVHLRRARDHVLHVVGVTRAVDVRVVARLALVLHVGGRDRDAALALFRSLVDLIERHVVGQTLLREDLRDRRRQRRLAMVHVADRADVNVVLRAFEFCACHQRLPPMKGPAGIRRLRRTAADPTNVSHDPAKELEPTSRIELLTACLPCKCSTA